MVTGGDGCAAPCEGPERYLGNRPIGLVAEVFSRARRLSEYPKVSTDEGECQDGGND